MLFHFVSIWKIQASQEKVWNAIIQADEWPLWWSSVKKNEIIHKPREVGGIGGKVSSRLKGYLPYTISFVTEVTHINKYNVIEVVAAGDVCGVGRWELHNENNKTRVRYTWDVRLQKPLLTFLSPFLYPLLVHNHNFVMKRGEEGLKKLLEKKE